MVFHAWVGSDGAMVEGKRRYINGSRVMFIRALWIGGGQTDRATRRFGNGVSRVLDNQLCIKQRVEGREQYNIYGTRESRLTEDLRSSFIISRFRGENEVVAGLFGPVLNWRLAVQDGVVHPTEDVPCRTCLLYCIDASLDVRKKLGSLNASFCRGRGLDSPASYGIEASKPTGRSWKSIPAS